MLPQQGVAKHTAANALAAASLMLSVVRCIAGYDGPVMSCLCSLRLASLLNSLPLPPPAALLPPFPLQLMAAVNIAAGAPPVLAAQASASVAAQAALMANLSLMANLTASARAALGVNLAVPLSSQAMVSLQATLSAHIGSLNANAGLLNQRLPDVMALLRALANLLHWVGLIGAVQAALFSEAW